MQTNEKNSDNSFDFSISVSSQRSYGIDSGIANTNTYSGLYTQHQQENSNRSKNRLNTNYLSLIYDQDIEPAILNAESPLNFDENLTEQITVLGERGIWLNKSEAESWIGEIPIENYSINNDPNPEVFNKIYSNEITYVQELAIRYLRPPTPPPPGPLIITEHAGERMSAAPPLIIRQQPPRPHTPEPLVIREAPPLPPPSIPVKRIYISGKKLPPPPRKLIIERLAPLPAKPQPVIIERWLPFPPVRRKVIYQKAEQDTEALKKQKQKNKNIIIQWESPRVAILQEMKNLGIIKANPEDYIKLFGNSLKSAHEMPQYVLELEKPSFALAADYPNLNPQVHELEGNIEALGLVDLELEGLEMYRPQIRMHEERKNASKARYNYENSIAIESSSVWY